VSINIAKNKIDNIIDKSIDNQIELIKKNKIFNFDSYPYNISLLLHMDGTNGSQTFIDDSINNLTVTANGNAQITNTQSKFGGGSAFFDGNGDYLEIVNNNAFEFGANNFTIECWFNIAGSRSNTKTLFSKGIPQTIDSSIYVFEFYGTNQLGFYVIDYSAAAPLVGTTTQIQQDTWYHLAIVRNGSNTKLFLNGIKESSNNSVYNISNGGTFNIGAGIYNIAGRSLNCYVDEFRITKGIARYTENFTPQTAPFANPEPLPTDGLVARFKSDAGVISTNNTITAWNDQSTHNNNATAFNGPTLITNQLYGRPAVSFDGINDYLTFNLDTPLQSGQARTFVVIGKYNDITNQHGFLNSIKDDLSYIFHSDNRGYYYSNGQQIAGPTLSVTGYHTTAVVHNSQGALSSIKINDIQDTNQILVLNNPPEITGFAIGYRDLNGQFLNGNIVELFVYNRVLSSREMTRIYDYSQVLTSLDSYSTAASSIFNIEQFLTSDTDEFILPPK